MRNTHIHRGNARISLTALALSALANLAACGSRPELDARSGPNDGTDMTGNGGSSPTDASTSGAGGTSSAGGTTSGNGGNGSAGTAGGGGANAVCPATCETALGTPTVFQTRAEANSALAGRWRICSKMSTAFPPMPADVIGFDVIPNEMPGAVSNGWWVDGSLYYLVDGPNGPTRGVGFDYQVSYRLTPFSNPTGLTVFQLPNSSFGSLFTFSACPRRWTLGGGLTNGASFAPL